MPITSMRCVAGGPAGAACRLDRRYEAVRCYGGPGWNRLGAIGWSDGAERRGQIDVIRRVGHPRPARPGGWGCPRTAGGRNLSARSAARGGELGLPWQWRRVLMGERPAWGRRSCATDQQIGRQRWPSRGYLACGSSASCGGAQHGCSWPSPGAVGRCCCGRSAQRRVQHPGDSSGAVPAARYGRSGLMANP